MYPDDSDRTKRKEIKSNHETAYRCVGIIFGPLIILGIAKIISTMSGTVKNKPVQICCLLKPKN